MLTKGNLFFLVFSVGGEGGGKGWCGRTIQEFKHRNLSICKTKFFTSIFSSPLKKTGKSEEVFYLLSFF